MIWIRDIIYPDDFKKTIVHGHTPQFKIINLPKQINLDTGAFYSGVLSCLFIDTKTGNRKIFNSKE